MVGPILPLFDQTRRGGFANVAGKETGMEKNIPTYASTLWDELDGKDLEDLFEKRPRFAEMYDWSKLKGADWTSLLVMRPLFADKCDWSKISKEKRAGLKLRLGK